MALMCCDCSSQNTIWRARASSITLHITSVNNGERSAAYSTLYSLRIPTTKKCHKSARIHLFFSRYQFCVSRNVLWCQTAEEWGNPVYIQSVRKKVPLRDLSLSLASQEACCYWYRRFQDGDFDLSKRPCTGEPWKFKDDMRPPHFSRDGVRMLPNRWRTSKIVDNISKITVVS